MNTYYSTKKYSSSASNGVCKRNTELQMQERCICRQGKWEKLGTEHIDKNNDILKDKTGQLLHVLLMQLPIAIFNWVYYFFIGSSINYIFTNIMRCVCVCVIGLTSLLSLLLLSFSADKMHVSWVGRHGLKFSIPSMLQFLLWSEEICIRNCFLICICQLLSSIKGGFEISFEIINAS